MNMSTAFPAISVEASRPLRIMCAAVLKAMQSYDSLVLTEHLVLRYAVSAYHGRTLKLPSLATLEKDYETYRSVRLQRAWTECKKDLGRMQQMKHLLVRGII